jgi:copper chaperone NosL
MGIERDEGVMAVGARRPVFFLRAGTTKASQVLPNARREGLLLARFVLALGVLLVSGCGSVELHPIEFVPEDMCVFCKMAISEKRFACELITPDEDVFKFDDISCMLRFRKERNQLESVAATFVVDFDTNEWLRFEEAYFVKSKEFKTPMGGSVVAFKTGPKAAAAADHTQGVSLRYAALLDP